MNRREFTKSCVAVPFIGLLPATKSKTVGEAEFEKLVEFIKKESVKYRYCKITINMFGRRLIPKAKTKDIFMFGEVLVWECYNWNWNKTHFHMLPGNLRTIDYMMTPQDIFKLSSHFDVKKEYLHDHHSGRMCVVLWFENKPVGV